MFLLCQWRLLPFPSRLKTPCAYPGKTEAAPDERDLVTAKTGLVTTNATITYSICHNWSEGAQALKY